MTNGTHIISKLTFDNLEIGPVPQPFYDNNKYTNIEWSRVNTTNCAIEIIDGTKYVRFNGANSKIYTTNSFIKDFNINNFEVEFDIIFDTLKDESNLFALGGNSEASNLRLVASTNPTKGLCLIQNTIQIKNYYKFENNKKYTICFSKINDTYYFYVDGLCIGYRDVSLDATKPTIPATSQVMFACSHNSLNDATKALYGKIANVNFSYGQSVKHYNSYTKHGNKLVSYLKIDNLNLTSSGTIYKVDLNTIKNDFVWSNIEQITYSSGYGKVKNLSITINSTYTLLFDTKKITNFITELLSYGDYKVTINLVQDGIEKEPEVIVNEYTTSALDFENGIIDQVGTTVWQKEGTAKVTSVNKIFGENSFETKSLGDSLYTNSKVITGGATPFTIEFYALIKKSQNGSSLPTSYNPIFTKNHSNTSSGGDQALYVKDNVLMYSRGQDAGGLINSQYDNHGSKKVFFNELNHYHISYDGSAIRFFLNGQLDFILGTNNGYKVTNDQPYRFLSSTYPNDTRWNGTSIGLIDNINIFDGIATKVRNFDPYEKNLIVDLAFDGENNSTKIVDNAITLTDDQYFPSASLLLNGNNPTLDLSRKSQNLVTRVRQVALTERAPKFSKTAFAIDANNPTISCNIEEIGFKPFTLEMWIDPRQPAGDYARFFEIGSENWSGGALYLCNPQYNYPAKLSLGVYVDSSLNSIRANDSFLKDQWNHVVLGRDSDGFIYTALNGKIQQVIDKSFGSTFNMADTRFRIGTSAYFPNSPKLSAYIDSLRVVVGQSVYSSATDFEVPEEPFGYNSSNNWTVFGTAKISTDQKFDGFSSLDLNGTNNAYIKTSNVFDDSFINKNENLTIAFDLRYKPFSSTSKVIFSTRSDIPSTRGFGLYLTDLKELLLIGWGGGTESFKFKTQILDINVNTNHSILINRNNLDWNFYIDNKLIATYIQTNYHLTSNKPFCIGTEQANDASSDYSRNLNGYIKNFKIYKGVAVIPESPVGKIQLDFDNNLVDKYGNSTWTNNGVTFDQVNSVSGYAVSINNNKFISTNTQNLNLSNLNSVIEFDVKPTNNITSYSNVMRRTDNTTEFMIRNNATGVYNSNIFLGILGAQTFNINNYYNWKMIRVDNGNLALIKFNDILVDVKNNGFVTFDISNFQIGQSSNSIAGYVDNFKVYKEDILSNDKIYKTTNATVNLENNAIKATHSASSGYSSYTLVLDDAPILNNFTAELEILITGKSYGCLTFGTTVDYSLNDMDKFGYSVYVAHEFIRFGRGSNNSTAAWVQLGSYTTQTDIRDSKYHNVKLVKNNSNFKIYLDNVFLFEVNDTVFSDVLSKFSINSYIAVDTISHIKSVKISDENEEKVYYKNWKSKIDNVIDKPAVHLPLETNSTNIGFTPLTINSVGGPTYTTIDGKKCIKFEQGKYLTINSNNIFNLGTSSDFCIEMDIYVPSLHTSGYGHSILNNGLPNGTDGMWLQYLPTSLGTDVGKVEIVRYTAGQTTISHRSSNAVNVGSWNSLKFYRKNDKVYIELNGVVSEFLNDINLNFSNGNTHIGMIYNVSTEATMDGCMSNFKMFVGTSEIPETYNDKKVLDLDFKPTGKSYLFKDNNNKCIIHPVNITQRDYQDSQYCCTFNGTDQYLQLGKNDLLNFGNDDFIFNFKFKINDFTKKYCRLFADGNSNDISYTAICGDSHPYPQNRRKLLFIIHDESGIYLQNINPLVENTIYDVLVVREGSSIKMFIDGAMVDEIITTLPYNLNGDNNTLIGSHNRSAIDISNKTFNGAIYSIKVLRNTSDLSLLEEVEETSNDNQYDSNTISLTNGVDNQEIEFINNDNNEFKFIHGEDSIKLISNNEILEVSKLEENSSDELIISNGINTYIKDIKLYNDIIEEDDIFEGNTAIDTQFDGIDIEDITTKFDILNVVDQGNFIIKGFFEGQPNNTPYSIRHKYEGFEMSSGVGEFHYNGIDKRYINDYVIINLTTNETIPVPQSEMIKGYINISVELSDCGQADFAIRVIRRLDNAIIGVYEFNGNLCNIPNLDCNKKYDCIIFDRNAIMESRSLSNRTPTPY